MARGLPPGAHLRARRWDVLVLGSALPGLAAAVRMGMAGLRVLIAEEDTAARTPDLLREPFFLPGGPVLDGCLRALGVPLIERRSLEARDLSYQVLLPDARVDVGGVPLTAEELVAWGLAKPDAAASLLRGLAEAGRAEGQILLEGGWIRRSAIRRTRMGGAGAAARGLPIDFPAAEGDLARFFDVQARVLASQPAAELTPEARARVLGGALAGGARFDAPDQTIRALLRRRLEALHGEIRTLGCPFGLVELGDAPGLARVGPDDAWLGRAMLLNAPGHRLAHALRSWRQDVPKPVTGEAPTHRRLAVHYVGLREAVPEPLADRAICWDGGDDAPIEIAQLPSGRGRRFVELVLAREVPFDADDEREAARMAAAVAEFVPDDARRAKRAPLAPRPLWDDEAARGPRTPGIGWPEPVDPRTPGRSAVYRIPRDGFASLGAEGELLLGWRIGDAIRDALA